MKKQNIAAALVCVVFLMGLWGGVAGGQEQRPDLPYTHWEPEPYLDPGLTPWDNNHFSGDDPYPAYDNLGSEPLNSGVGVPEPGSLVLLISGGLCLLGWAWRRRRRR